MSANPKTLRPIPAQQKEATRLLVFAEGLDYKRSLELLALTTDEEGFFEKNRLYLNGDHWQEGDAWIGPEAAANNPAAGEIKQKLERMFCSKNIISEIIGREVNAVIGHQPDWTLTVRRSLVKVPRQIPDPENPEKMIDDPSGIMVDEPIAPDEQQLISDGNSLSVAWWDDKSLLEVMQKAARYKLNFGRGPMRQFVPPKFLQAGYFPAGSTIADVMKAIFVEVPEPEDARVYTDRVTQEKVGITSFKLDDDSIIIELSYVDGDGVTWLKTLTESDEGTDKAAAPTLTVAKQKEGTPGTVGASDGLSLGGALTLFEVKGRPLISAQIRQNQNVCNLALTMMAYNVVEAGFSERVITNADVDEITVADSTAPGGTRKIPNPMPRGSGLTTNVVGIQYLDDEGRVHITTPGVHYRDPAPVKTFVDTKAEAYRNCLDEAHQLHALIAGDATVSGESRVQALADFLLNALHTKGQMDAAGKWLIETGLAWAAHLAGEPDKFAELRCAFDCKIDVGKLSADEKRALMDEVKLRLRSRKSYMLITGQQDPDAEFATIISEGEVLMKITVSGEVTEPDKKPTTDKKPEPEPKPEEE